MPFSYVCLKAVQVTTGGYSWGTLLHVLSRRHQNQLQPGRASNPWIRERKGGPFPACVRARAASRDGERVPAAAEETAGNAAAAGEAAAGTDVGGGLLLRAGTEPSPPGNNWWDGGPRGGALYSWEQAAGRAGQGGAGCRTLPSRGRGRARLTPAVLWWALRRHRLPSGASTVL